MNAYVPIPLLQQIRSIILNVPVITILHLLCLTILMCPNQGLRFCFLYGNMVCNVKYPMKEIMIFKTLSIQILMDDFS